MMSHLESLGTKEMVPWELYTRCYFFPFYSVFPMQNTAAPLQIMEEISMWHRQSQFLHKMFIDTT